MKAPGSDRLSNGIRPLVLKNENVITLRNNIDLI